MLDIDRFKALLSSLSRSSALGFEIWNREGLLFSSVPVETYSHDLDEIRDFSTRIMSDLNSQHAGNQNHGSLFGVPLVDGDSPIGALIAYGAESPNQVDPEESLALLTSLADIMQHQHRSQKEADEIAEELINSFEDLHLYSRIASQIKTLKLSNNMLKGLLEDIMDTMRADLVFIRFPGHAEYNVLVTKKPIPSRFASQDELTNQLLRLISTENGSLQENYFLVSDSRDSTAYGELHSRPFRFLAVRVQHRGKDYGWLGVVAFNVKEIFRMSELRLLVSMAEQMAVVIANTEMFRNLEGFVINVVKSLIYAIEAKDEYTRGHSERVNRYCTMLAEWLKINEKDKYVLHWASILHDVGKIGIPESILNKPGSLTNEEYELVKKHSRKGYEILKPIDHLSDSLPAILHHHERYDGKGYPDGLTAEQIPRLARIIAIADTFDAITSDRAYRLGKSPDEALGIMLEVAGSQLDYGLFEAFKELWTGRQTKREGSHGR